MRNILFTIVILVIGNICVAGDGNWMAAVRDNALISQLSVPGTHDSGALYEPISGTAKCQSLSIADQLNAGVRFLDIRCRHIDNAFAIHHGYVYQNQNFDGVLNACIDFLAANPSETIVMSVKEEYDASNNTRSFEATFNSYVAKNPARWHLGTTMPALGNVRGKIVLFRRFGSSAAIGLNATNWADDTIFSIGGNAPMRVQDNYSNGSGSEKWTDVNNMLNEAASGKAGTLYANFSSGYTSGFLGIPSITTVSNYVNPRLETYFNQSGLGRYGTIIMDFANAARGRLIYQTNNTTPGATSTKAYWRFENGAAGQFVQHLAGEGTYSADIADVSGSGNGLAVWKTGPEGGYTYSGNIAYNEVGRTTLVNTRSVKNSGNGPTMFCNNSAMRSWSPQAFTLEATIKFQSGGYRTYIGRDSYGTNSGNADLAALYVQATPDNALAFKFCDAAGNWHEAISGNGIITTFDNASNPGGNGVPWYSLAAISDGKIMSLYMKNHSNSDDYQLIAQHDISGSNNTRLNIGSGSGGDWQAGTITVGRGMYGGRHEDRGYGYIDEVRITDGALDIFDLLQSKTTHNSSVTQSYDIANNDVDVTLNWNATPLAGSGVALSYIVNQYVFMSNANDNTLRYIGATGDPGINLATALGGLNLLPGAHYRWQIVNAKAGVESNLTVNSSTIADVNANSIFGPVWSFDTLQSGAIITGQPTGGLVESGDNFMFTVAATSSSAMVYKWYYSSDRIVGNDTFKANGNTFMLAEINAGDGGYYYCVVTNGSGIATYSDFAQLEVKGPVAWYMFEDNMLDAVGGYNGAAPGAAVSYSEGIAGRCLAINGTDQYVEVECSIQNSFTIGLWVRTTATGGTGGWWEGVGLVDGEIPNSVNDFGTVILGNKFGFGVGNPDVTISSDTTINDNQWHYCVATRDSNSGEMKIYIDGLLETAEIGATGRRDSTSTLTIGRINTAANYFAGEIDEVRLYNYPLDEMEIVDNYSNISGRSICLPWLKPDALLDANGDCIINLRDMATLSLDLLELTEFAGSWLDCGRYPECTE